MLRRQAQQVDASGPSFPLRYRVRNAPPLFVGRALEIDALARSLERGPLSVVTGLGGLGKTSLVLHTLNTRFAARVDRCVMIGVRERDSAAKLAWELLHAISLRSGMAAIVAGEGPADVDELFARAIDLADESDVWVVIDDLHLAGEAVLSALCEQIAAYARRARWVFTSRINPRMPNLVGQALPLPSMQPHDLAELARRCDPTLEETPLDRVVRRSNGSPWRLHQALAGDPLDECTMLGALRDDARELVAMLGLLGGAVPIRALQDATGMSADLFAELARRGLVEVLPSGARLHDAARDHSTASAGVDTRALADRLAACNDPSASVEAVRLHAAAGRMEEASALLRDRRASLFEEGLAPRLFDVLQAAPDASLHSHRFACAAEIALGPALAWANEQPRPELPVDRFEWARARAHAGRLEEATDELLLLAREPGVAEDLTFEVALSAARYLLTLGRADEAVTLLEARESSSPEANARRLAILASALVRGERYREALALALELERIAAQSRAAVRAPVLRALTGLYMATGRGRDAWRVSSALHEIGDGAFHAASDLQLRAMLCMEAGRSREALAICERLVSAPPMLRPYSALLELRLRMSIGAFEDAESRIEETLQGAASTGNAYVYWWAAAARLELSIHRGTPRDSITFSSKVRPAAGPARAYFEAFEALHAAHHGTSDRPAASPAEGEVIDVRLLDGLARGVSALVAGDPSIALEHAAAVSAAAHEHGWSLLDASARILACQAAIVRGDDETLDETVGAFAALCSEMESERLRATLRMFEMARARALHPVLLEALSLEPNVAPSVCRQARALLGGESSGLDRVEVRVVDGIERRAGKMVRDLRRDGEHVWREGWGLDLASRTVWLPRGRILDLREHETTWRVLTTMLGHDGFASKAELSRSVWEVASYHPLRDDKRIQVAIRRLRMLLEDEPSNPVRVETRADGYAFGPREPVRVLRDKVASVS